jgi:FlaA1/EpsC-like NDP-sugar epimerase
LPLLALDVALGLLAWWVAFWLRFNLDVPPEFARLAWVSSPWCALGMAAGLVLRRVDRQVWTYIGLAEFRQLAGGVVLGSVFTAVAVLMLRLPDFPRSVLLLQPVLPGICVIAQANIFRVTF